MKSSLRPVALALLFAGACAKDPTAGKTKATVGEARHEGAVAGGEALPITPQSSSIRFVGAKITAQHPGRFSDFSGTISLVDDAPEKSRVEVTVSTASLSTDEDLPRLENHLRSDDFFDVEKYPTARFVSTEIKPGSDVAGATHTVTGNLELRGVTRSVTFPATIKVNRDAVGVSAEFGINRKDFGIEYPGKRDDLIKDNVLLTIELSAPRGPRS
jgi:polyisoprenoid-binding protein YceI